MKASFLIILISCTLFACKRNSSSEQQATTSKEASQVIKSNDEEDAQSSIGEEVPVAAATSEFQGFQVFTNQRFNFNIDVPSHWSATTTSEVGDGFVVKVPNYSSVEIRVFGEEYKAEIMQFYDDNCSELTDFEFNNGITGKRCVGVSDMTYWIDIENTRLNVYIENWDDLDIAQKSNFTTMVKSLRRGGKTEVDLTS